MAKFSFFLVNARWLNFVFFLCKSVAIESKHPCEYKPIKPTVALERGCLKVRVTKTLSVIERPTVPPRDCHGILAVQTRPQNRRQLRQLSRRRLLHSNRGL